MLLILLSPGLILLYAWKKVIETTRCPGASGKIDFIGAVGMGLTVAPLTTTVMSSVSEKLAGAASGINKAASRVAGVLAIAITGSIALISFNHSALNRISDIDLPAGARYELEKKVLKFGDAEVPEIVPPEHLQKTVHL